MMEEEQKDNQTIDNLVDYLRPLVEHMKHIHDMAVFKRSLSGRLAR